MQIKKALLKKIILVATFIFGIFLYKNYSAVYVKNSKTSYASREELVTLLEKVEFYQPLYNVKFSKLYNLNYPAKRYESTIERAKTLEVYLSKIAKYKSLKILDVGSSLGYFSLYFADRGNFVDGIDFSENNVKIAKLLAKLNNISRANFEVKTFDDEFIDNLPYHYDVVFIFSVLHHVINAHGLEYTQDLMMKLLDKVPYVIVELAKNDEDVTFSWKDKLPANELAVFDKCANCEILKLGEYGTHLSDTKRPLYVVKKKTITVNNKEHQVSAIKFGAYRHDSEVLDSRNRKYYFTDEFFIKDIVANESEIKSCDNVVDFHKKISEFNPPISTPKLLDYEKMDNRYIFVYEKLDAENLADIVPSLDKETKRSIMYKVLENLAYLETKNIGFYDFRIWNVLTSSLRDKIYLIDFDEAKILSEPTNYLNDFLWFLQDLNTGHLVNLNHEGKPKDFGIFQDIADLILDGKVKNSKELLALLKEKSE
jgi:SAM-dependent methyltransferase